MTSSAELIAMLDESLELELRELLRADPGARFDAADGTAWCVGAPPGAVVFHTSLDAASVDQVIAERLRAFEAARLDVTWWAGPSDRPADLRSHLAEANFVPVGDEAGMVVDLGHLVESVPTPFGLELVATGAEDELDERVINESFNVAELSYCWPPGRRVMRRSLNMTDEPRPRPWRHVVARLNGTAVASARVLVRGQSAMVHDVATVPSARRHGIGTAVTLRALQLGRDAGATIGVLRASCMCQGPERRLGFEQVASYGQFVRPAERPVRQ